MNTFENIPMSVVHDFTQKCKVKATKWYSSEIMEGI